MNIGQLLGGAGVVGRSMREAEQAERVARESQLAIEEQNRLADLKAQMARTQLGSFQPQAAPDLSAAFTGLAAPVTGPDAGIVPVQYVAPPAAAPAAGAPGAAPAAGAPGAAPAAGAPGAALPPGAAQVRVQPPAALPFGQEVPNPMGNERLFQNAQEVIRMREMRIRDIQTGLDRLTSGGAPARMIENQKQLLAREQGLLEAARQGAQRVAPTVPYGLEGRNVPPPQPTDPSAMFAGLEQKYGLPLGLLNAVMMAESQGKPGQTSSKGAQGYFQFMPATAKQYGVRVNDLNSEAEGAAKMLSDLLKMTGGDLNKALAGYNWGIGNVQRRGMDRMPAETRNYIPKVMAYMQQPAAPGAAPAGPSLPSLPPAAAAPTAPAAPSAGINIPGISSAQAATPPAPAAGGPSRVEVSGTSDFYLANPQSIPYEQQRLNQAFQFAAAQAQQQVALLNRQRNESAQLAQIYMRSGTAQGIEAANRLRGVIDQYDAQMLQTQQQVAQARQQVEQGRTYLEGMQGLQEFALANDPRRLASVWSLYAGVPIGIQPRTDGRFNIMVNGKKTKDGVSADELTSSARLAFDQTYRQQQAAAGAEYNKERFKTSLKIQENQAQQLAQMIREVAVQRVQGNTQLALEQLKQFRYDVKPTGAGDGTVIITPPGASTPYLFNPTGRTIEIDGVKIQSNAAYPIAGLPSYGGQAATQPTR